MKRIICLLTVAILLAGFSFAENLPYASITPKTAKSMAMGGVFGSVPSAEFSFFGNPAAFASKKGTFILGSLDTWAYVRPTAANIKSLTDNAQDTGALLSRAFGMMSENGGTGGGATAGLGYAGNGLGLGIFATTDEYAQGSSPASAVLHSETELSSVIGLAIPLQLGGMRLSLGGDLRPFYRISFDKPLADILNTKDANGKYSFDAITASVTGDAFFGVAMDVGASLQLNSLTIGLSIRDISPSYLMSSDNVKAILDSLKGGNLPAAGANANSAVFTPNLAAGLSWSPRLLPGIIDPSLYFEIQDPVSIIKDKDSVWNLLHAGAEIKCLSFIMLRGGINRGWLSAGAGLTIPFLDINAAIFTEELGALPGDNPRSGLALQAAIRF